MQNMLPSKFGTEKFYNFYIIFLQFNLHFKKVFKH